ncbi:MAG: arsenic efflux protein [Bacteroidales bacterium]|nr:arsenic efflux protein [Candidatus Latescibacterota bacterium]
MIDVLRNTFMITGFVFVMMLVIEFLNVLTSGSWQHRLARSRFGKYIFAAILGAIPGCLGAFAAVAMYSHGVLTLGAVVTAMIATSGDEAFVMLAMIPGPAIVLAGILIVVGIIAGILTDIFAGKAGKAGKTTDPDCCEMVVHEDHVEQCFVRGQVLSQWKNCTAARGILAVMLVLLIAAIVTGQLGHHDHGEHDLQVQGGAEESLDESHQVTLDDHEGHDHHEGDVHHDEEAASGEHVHHDEDVHTDEHAGPGESEWDWVRMTMLISSLVALFIVGTVSDHFLEEHLWEHIARKHLLRIFLWTFSALLALYLLTDYLHLDILAIASERGWIILGIACLVGLIPQSGPHLVFVTLFAQGLIPFSVLLAGSIVQDGHGMLPMLADSRRSFLLVKMINLVAGLIIGAAAFAAGY